MLYWLLEQFRSSLDKTTIFGDFTLYSLVRLLDELEFRTLAAAGIAFLFVLCFGPMTIARLRAMKIGDTGITDAAALRKHAESKANVPTMGGVLIVGAIFTSVFLLADITEAYVYMALILLIWMAVVGGADDWLKLTAVRRGDGRQGLHAWEKLVFQLGIATLIGVFAYNQGDGREHLTHVLNLPLQSTYKGTSYTLSESLVYLSKPFYVFITVMMIAGLSNAVNISDGMDGLSSGLVVIVSIGLLVLTLIAGQDVWAQRMRVPHIENSGELAVIVGAMVGACLGFLWWNCSPAQVFMGDTGSLTLGALVGYIAVVIRQEVLVLMMCGVFLIEIGSVVLQVGYFKSTGGKRIFRCAPYHHHLHLGGWREQQVVARLWIVGVVLVIVALGMLKVR
ncbi:MAG: phospho-N-acetylmuramoyl-pentapeptide-transferase [Phycisphaerales bacterium JB061]